MKLQNNSIGTISQGFESKDISVVSVNADALEIVSQMFQNDIYSNKLEAAIRETIANAIDEHIKYNVDQDVEVRLERNKSETWLSVRDFAKGLDEKSLREIFGGLFCSTKNLTNSATGGFGIGAKSPICYAENFTVTSFFNKKKTSFVFYRDRGVTGSSITKIAKFNEEETDEPSGIEVKIPIAYNDIQKANSIIISFVRNLQEDTKIIFFNQEREEFRPNKEQVWNIDNFKICIKSENNTSSLKEVGIRMGSIVYPLPSFFNFDLTKIRQGHTLIDVPIGTFSMPPSRETLSDVPENIKAWERINSLISQFHNKTRDLIKLKFEDLIKEAFELECFSFNIKLHFNITRFGYKGDLNGKNKVAALFESGKMPHWRQKKINYFLQNNPNTCFFYTVVDKYSFKQVIEKLKSVEGSFEIITEKDNRFKRTKDSNNLDQEFVFQFKRGYHYVDSEKLSIKDFISANPIPEGFDIEKVSCIETLKKACIAVSPNNTRQIETNIKYCCKTAVDILVKNGYFNLNDHKVKSVYEKLLQRKQERETKRRTVNTFADHSLLSSRSKKLLEKLMDKEESIDKAISYVHKLEKTLDKISGKSKLHKKLVDKSYILKYNGFNRKEIKNLIKNVA